MYLCNIHDIIMFAKDISKSIKLAKGYFTFIYVFTGYLYYKVTFAMLTSMQHNATFSSCPIYFSLYCIVLYVLYVIVVLFMFTYLVFSVFPVYAWESPYALEA